MLTRSNSFQRVLLFYLLFLFVYWLVLNFVGLTTSIYNFLFSFLFSLIPLIGGLVGIFRSKLWGGLASYLGKAVFFISLGLFFWGAGSMIWSYYNIVLGISAPYPSWADLGFAPSIFFYGLGAFFLSKVTGAGFGFRKKSAKIFAILAPVVIFLLSYYVLVIIARAGVLVPDGETVLKTILDVAYPLGDFAALTIAVVTSGLSFNYLGGKYLVDIISILIGLAVMYLADFIFSYTTTVGTFYNGNYGDLMLALGLFFLTFGVAGFYKLKE